MFLLIVAAVGLFVTGAVAEVPHIINYQGIIEDENGVPLYGPHTLTFRIYPDSAQGAPVLWIEEHSNVQLGNGQFNVLLGSLTQIHDSLFASDERWMGISVDYSAEIKPRTQITSVAWALKAAVADSALSGPGVTEHSHHSLDAADGDPVEAVQVDDDGNVWMNWTMPPPTDIAKLSIYTNETGSVQGLDLRKGPSFPPGQSLLNVEDGTNNYLVVKGDGTVYTNYGNVGIGTSNPTQLLQVAGSMSLNRSGSKGLIFADGGASQGGVSFASSNSSIRVTSSSGVGLTLLPGDKFGIATTNPTRTLEVSGNGYVRDNFDVGGQIFIRNLPDGITGHPVMIKTNGTVFKELSTIRCKDDVEDLGARIGDVLSLRPVRFKWKSSGEKGIGLIAEEVAEKCDDLVIYGSDGKPEGVRYDKVSIYLLEVVKEQQAAIEQMREELNDLRK
jgi:hypothetical protein